jgi:type I restriction enzyme, S subunit
MLFDCPPTDWRTATLGEICREGGGDIQTGPFGSQLHASDYVDAGIPSIMPANIKGGRVVEDGIARITEDDANRLFKYLVAKGDIVYSRRGDVERCALIREKESGWLCGTGCLRVRPGADAIDSDFCAHFLSHPETREWISRHAVGATMPNLNTQILSDVPILLPPRTEQKAIAHILGTLDEKIELNRKTNETLEAMAKALFKSWFVDFDPVRAKAEGRPTRLPAEISDLFPDSFEDSELGEIPSGWSVSCVNDLCEWVSSGGTPSRSRKDFWENGNIPWFKTGELNDAPLMDSGEKINELALGNSSCKLWEAGTILFAIYASPTVGRLGVLTASGTSNQAAAGLKAKGNIGTPFLRRTLLFSRDELQNIAVGAAQQNINVQILKVHKVIAPGTALASAYSSTVFPLDEKQIWLAKSTRELCSLRDALLPKLISGEIRIPDAEKMLEEVGV